MSSRMGRGIICALGSVKDGEGSSAALYTCFPERCHGSFREVVRRGGPGQPDRARPTGPAGPGPAPVHLRPGPREPGGGGNTNYWLNPYTTLQQQAYNTAVVGSALSTIPPYWLGFNPYPQYVTYGYGGYGGYSPYGYGGYGSLL